MCHYIHHNVKQTFLLQTQNVWGLSKPIFNEFCMDFNVIPESRFSVKLVRVPWPDNHKPQEGLKIISPQTIWSCLKGFGRIYLTYKHTKSFTRRISNIVFVAMSPLITTAGDLCPFSGLTPLKLLWLSHSWHASHTFNTIYLIHFTSKFKVLEARGWETAIHIFMFCLEHPAWWFLCRNCSINIIQKKQINNFKRV